MTTAVKKSPTIVCTKCGKQINPAANFCNFCGQKNTQRLEVTATVSTPVAVEKKAAPVAAPTELNEFQTLKSATTVTARMLAKAEQAQLTPAQLEELLVHPDKYCAAFALKKLTEMNADSSWLVKFIQKDPTWAISLILLAGLQPQEEVIKLIKDQLQRINSVWLSRKFQDLVKVSA